jgi:LPXTG-motif cell wall-anchored protein
VFKLSRSLLALLAAMAMVLLWSGTATAVDPPAPLPECVEGMAPETCLAPDLPLIDQPADDEGAASDEGAAGEEETSGTEDDGSDGTDGGAAAAEGDDAPSCDDLPETPLPLCELPDCDDLPDTPLPLCEEEPPPLPPCETVEDLPLCIPDCEFLAELLGQEGCELPDCIDTTQLPAEIVELLDQLPPELREQVPFCPAEPVVGNPPPEDPPGATPVGHENPAYENCDDARAHGAAPVYEGEPGYGPHLDSDHDGIGCEEDTVVPVSHHTGGGGQLAYTGAEFGTQLTLAGVLLLVGSGLLLATRRRT